MNGDTTVESADIKTDWDGGTAHGWMDDMDAMVNGWLMVYYWLLMMMMMVDDGGREVGV